MVEAGHAVDVALVGHEDHLAHVPDGIGFVVADELDGDVERRACIAMRIASVDHAVVFVVFVGAASTGGGRDGVEVAASAAAHPEGLRLNLVEGGVGVE